MTMSLDKLNQVSKEFRQFVKDNFKEMDSEDMVSLVSGVFGFALEEDNSGQLVLYTDVYPNGNLDEEEG